MEIKIEIYDEEDVLKVLYNSLKPESLDECQLKKDRLVLSFKGNTGDARAFVNSHLRLIKTILDLWR